MMCDAQLDLCLTHYLMIYLDCLCNRIYLGSFYCIRFSQMVLSVSCTFPYSFPTTLFLTPTHLILPFLPSPHPSKAIHSISPSQDIYPTIPLLIKVTSRVALIYLELGFVQNDNCKFIWILFMWSFSLISIMAYWSQLRCPYYLDLFLAFQFDSFDHDACYYLNTMLFLLQLVWSTI